MANDTQTAIATEAKRLEEDVLYAEKQHFSMATVWRRIHLALGIPSVIAAALSGMAALKANAPVAVFLAVISAVLTALLTFLNPQAMAAAHHRAGIKYSDLRGRLRRLYELDLSSSDLPAVKQRLIGLAEEKTKVMTESPHIGGLAYLARLAGISRMKAAYKPGKWK